MNSRNLYSSFEVSDSTELEGKREDYLTNETPIAISYNGISHVVMMATPNDLEDFAIGFSFSEGIVQSKDDIFDIQIKKNSNGTEINLEIDQENFINLKKIKRNLSGKTGCGICGVESLDYFSDRLNRLYPSRNEILLKKDIIFKSLSDFNNSQEAHSKTGSIHAASFFDSNGKILSTSEDVGRHNALDKLIGRILVKRLNGGFVICSSRASYEMVQKILVTKIPILIAISAPTSMAVELAKKNNLTLIGFAREKRFVVYSHKERIIE